MTTLPDPPNYSRPPLDALHDALDKGYVGLRVEQGVPVLDRDLNLLGDLVAATLRGVVARYIGDGVAAGSEAFAIAPADGDNDFEVRAGAEPPGRCLVGGVEATISTTVRYREQRDGDGQPLEGLTTPDASDPDPRDDTVYLDVWLAEEAGADDADLLNPDDVGMRTSTRARVAWLVRVAQGGDPPAPERGHLHYPLARLRRPRSDDRIRAGHITDLRRTHLNLAEVEERVGVLERLPERLLTDLFDVSPSEYESGEGRPVISARAALNALLHGQMPGTPEQRPDDVDAYDLHWHAALAGDGSVYATWVRGLPETPDERMIMAQRVRPDGAHDAPVPVTDPVPQSAGSGIGPPTVATLAQDRVVVAYRLWGGGGSGEARARFKLAPIAELGAAEEHGLDALDFMQLGVPYVVPTGSLVTFLITTGQQMVYLRLRWTLDPDEWWVDEEPQTLGDAAHWGAFSASADGAGRIWVAYGTGDWQDHQTRVQRLDPESGSVDRDTTRDDMRDASLHCTADGVPWMFWRDDSGQHHCASFDGDDWQDRGHLPITGQNLFSLLTAADSRDGGLWLFTTRDLPDAGYGVAATRRDPDTGFWSPMLPVGPSTGESALPFAVSDGGPTATLFYGHAETSNQFAVRMFRKRLVTEF